LAINSAVAGENACKVFSWIGVQCIQTFYSTPLPQRICSSVGPRFMDRTCGVFLECGWVVFPWLVETVLSRRIKSDIPTIRTVAAGTGLLWVNLFQSGYPLLRVRCGTIYDEAERQLIHLQGFFYLPTVPETLP
jgi:hypothetical protein